MIVHLAFLSALSIFHALLSHPRVRRARYFMIHALFNAWVVHNVLADATFTIAHPTITYTTSPTIIYHVALFHLYHWACYETSMDDKVHHIINVFVVAPLLWSYPNNITSLGLFFMCGLPGGLIYVLLTLHKVGLISKTTVKRSSKHINMWIRAPGIVVTCYLIGLNYVTSPHLWVRLTSAFVLVASMWNGMYFLSTIILSEHGASRSHPPT